MRRRLRDLLRRVHLDGLHADHNHHHDHAAPDVCVRPLPGLRGDLRSGRGLLRLAPQRRLRVLPRRHPAVRRLALSRLQRHMPGERAVWPALRPRRLRVRARRHHAVRRGRRRLRPRELPDRAGVRPPEHARAHLLHLRSCGRPLLRGGRQLRAGSGVQRGAGPLPLLPSLTARAGYGSAEPSRRRSPSRDTISSRSTRASWSCERALGCPSPATM